MGFAERLAELMAERGISGRELARRLPCDRSYISLLTQGKRRPSPEMGAKIDDLLGAGGELAALAAPQAPEAAQPPPAGPGLDDETAALDFGRLAAASDAGEITVQRLEQAADSLAAAYHRTPPAELLGRVRLQMGYAGRLLDGRSTLDEHRRILVAGGWLSLLAATCLIDAGRNAAAAAHLGTAAQLARETGHAEIAGWCLETRAWQVLTAGDYRGAVTLAQAAQRAAPPGSSAFIQATAQEGRAWARLGAKPEAYEALARTEALASRLLPPDRPEHHYHYDPAKSQAYSVTILSWLGDPAAETRARKVLARMDGSGAAPPRPRRAAAARLDLGLALAAAGRPDEAAATALRAVTSGLLVPSNYWRAGEVIAAVNGRDVSEARELEDAYREFCARPAPVSRPELA
jgi:transcriptional regulator with XRE-family HTH domain